MKNINFLIMIICNYYFSTLTAQQHNYHTSKKKSKNEKKHKLKFYCCKMKDIVPKQ